MVIYAVIDTNVFVSAFITHNASSPTVQIFNAILDGKIIPVIHPEILDEYKEVLCRPKFNLNFQKIEAFISKIQAIGKTVKRNETGIELPDKDDLIFYEVAMSPESNNSHLVTGNIKHFPHHPRIVTPTELLKILNESFG